MSNSYLRARSLLSRVALLLDGKTVGVIGFNARPIACSLKRLGAKTLVSDYWGDDDLTECSTRWISVQNPQPGQRQHTLREHPVHEALVDNFLGEFSNDVDFIVLGSGFDDHPIAIANLESHVKIMGNDSKAFKRARNRNQLSRLADKFGLNYPRTIRARTIDRAVKAADLVGYPCIVRRTTSGGGGGIRLVRDEQSLRSFLVARKSLSKSGILVQQYISGIDGSVTVIGTGESSKVISVQGQLIGLPSAGRNCDFVYCGNYWPLSAETPALLIETFESLVNHLNLRGYNGIDFVIDKDGRPWLLEINPRITGTLEMLELASNTSIMTLHIQGCNGQNIQDNIVLRPIVKMIVFARQSGTVPDLTTFANTVDRTPLGVAVERGDPICSVLFTGNNFQSLYEYATMTSFAIQQAVK